MDIHAPLEPIHSWRDIALHLGIITIGLFIALSLEGFVEYIHNRHLVHEARINIRHEIEANHTSAQQDIVYLQQDMDRTKANIAMIHRLIADPKTRGSLSYTMEFSSLDDAAWTTARETGALGFMSYQEVQSYSDLYQQQTIVDDQYIEVSRRQTLAMTPAQMGDDFSKLPPNETDALLHDTTATLIDLFTLKQILQQLDAQYVDELKK